MAEDRKKLQELSETYQKLQQGISSHSTYTNPARIATHEIPDLQTIITARQKLSSQHQENKGVQQEFANFPTDSNIYKLVGPVLLKQERSEAVMAVNGRLEFIEREM